jgi:predicted NUDIX family NTP pyrophosphohydrolase
MPRLSAGILLFRKGKPGTEVLLVHPGGPFWEKKDLGAWSLPKGEYDRSEDPLSAAVREFEEETSFRLPPGDLIPLGELRQPSGKIIAAWALKGDLDATLVKSNVFEMEWPRKSGAMREYPEVDRAEWFTLVGARQKLLKGQVGFLIRLAEALSLPPDLLDQPENDPSAADQGQSSLF